MMRATAYPASRPMSQAEAAKARSDAREFMNLARLHALAALGGGQRAEFGDLPLADQLKRHRQIGCPLADAPARKLWDAVIEIIASFIQTTDPDRRSRQAEAIAAGARAFAGMLDDTSLEAAQAWKSQFRSDWA